MKQQLSEAADSVSRAAVSDGGSCIRQLCSAAVSYHSSRCTLQVSTSKGVSGYDWFWVLVPDIDVRQESLSRLSHTYLRQQSRETIEHNSTRDNHSQMYETVSHNNTVDSLI